MSEKNDFQKICDKLEKITPRENEIKMAKKEIQEYAEGDRENVLKIKAEASEIGTGEYLSVKASNISMVIAGVSFLTTVILGIADYIEKDFICKITIFFYIIFLITILVGYIHYEKSSFRKNENARKWQKYIIVAIEEILENQVQVSSFIEDKMEEDERKYFGTDGFRGEANKILTADHAYKIGRYLGWYYNQNHKGRIIIGKDTRRSSYMFEYALVAGITASGADAFLLHVTTTPSVAYVVRTENFDCGIMVSASHNPYYDNGIKVMDGEGHKISAEVEAALEKYIDDEMGELPFATREQIGVAKDYAIGRNRYIGYLISLATRSYDGMRVGLDCSNGSTFNIAKSVFDALGAKTYVVGNEPDGTNINMGCGSTHIENLQKLVREKNLDCGFAFDGDADRCIAVDENGMEVHGDYILYVCGKYLKECGRLQNNTVVATIMSNMGLFKSMKREGIEVCVTTVGDKYVNEAMVANGYVLGGEQSGHIIFSKHATTGDGILTAIMLMEVILEKKQSLGTLCRGMQIYPQLLQNVKVEDKAAVTGNAHVQEEKERITAALGEDGRILLRESGTEPVIRVMVEAQSDELCAKYVDKMVQVIRKEGLAAE